MSDKRFCLLAWVVLFALIGTPACAAASQVSQPAIDLDPIFVAFYNDLGGEKLLGSTISEPFRQGTSTYQYTRNVLLVYNPEATAARRFGFAPLSSQIGLAIPVSDSQLAVAPDFVAAYQKLYGSIFTGAPLTPLKYNEKEHRYEQYFENLGFYRPDGADQEAVYLLPYGEWAQTEAQGRP